MVLVRRASNFAGIQRIWVLRDGQHAIVPARVELELEFNGGKLLDASDVEWTFDSLKGIPIPHVVHYQRTQDDVVVIDEQLTVEVMVLDEALPQDTFTIAGLPTVRTGMPVSWVASAPDRVSGASRDSSQIWSGSEIVRKTGLHLLRGNPREPSKGFPSIVLLINICAMICVVTTLVVSSYRRRQRKRESHNVADATTRDQPGHQN